VVGYFPGDEQGIARNRFGMCLRAVLSQRLIKSETKQSRSIAMEILHVNKAVSNLIAMDKSKQIYSVIETSRADGMQTMDQALSNLAKRGKITPKQAMAYATHPLAVEKLLRQTA
jgi:twitching motility protein PilT